MKIYTVLKAHTHVTLTAGLSLCLFLSLSVPVPGAESVRKQKEVQRSVESSPVNSTVVSKVQPDDKYQAGEIPDPKDVVAWVNGVPLDLRSLEWAMDDLRQEQAQKRGGDNLISGAGEQAVGHGDRHVGKETRSATYDEALRQLALERLINEELAVQEARRLGIRPHSGSVSSVLSKFRSNMESPARYDEYLSAQDVTETELRKRIARDNIFKQITARKILAKIKVDPAKVREIYENNRTEFTFPEKMVVTDLHFLPGPGEDKVREHAEQVLSKLKAAQGSDILKLEPDGTFLVRTIHITEESDPELYFVVWDMEPGDISDVISTDDGLHIVSLRMKSPEREMTFEEARPRIEHKLIIPEYIRLREEFYQALRSRAEIIIPEEGEENVEREQPVEEQAGQKDNIESKG